jgi:hypothetical protein
MADLKKIYLLKTIYDLEMTEYIRNSESGQIYIYKFKLEIWFPRSIEDIVNSLISPFPAVGMLTLYRS